MIVNDDLNGEKMEKCVLNKINDILLHMTHTFVLLSEEKKIRCSGWGVT